MSAKAKRAIQEKATSFGREKFNRFAKQHGAMGRVNAPQRRSHHHRPVISFKEQLTSEK